MLEYDGLKCDIFLICKNRKGNERVVEAREEVGVKIFISGGQKI